ncbi:hypothetical protein GNP89_13535 [Aliivibrio fischeri]|uniref:hypothetical protein n=1 Tax=Aliivibrio fischeri TaxID=668 RepID=UPI0012D860FF|nr:hypothetical protein [Aliivibrio fischeri]MUL03198.1 hypothetical protein [Aliivibrio fischeri]
MTIHRLHAILEPYKINSVIDGKIDVACTDSSLIPEVFLDFGYTKNQQLFRRGNLNFSINTVDWSGKKVFYTTEEEIFEYVDSCFSLPNNTLFLDTSKDELELKVLDQELDIYKKLKILLEFRSLLADLSDHAIPDSGKSKGSVKAVLLIKTDDGGSKHDINTSITFKDFLITCNNIDLDTSLNLIKKLKQCIQLDDQQDKERKNCMRSALDSIINKLDDNCNLFQFCLKNISKIYKTYTEHHNIFLSDFTINKVVQEINNKDLEYTGKINDITSSVQTKALAIPGAMVAISAVMKVETITSAIGIVLALWATCLVIHKSLNIYASSFLHLKKQIKNVFSRYQLLNQKSEIRKEAKETEKSLLNMAQVACSGIKFVKIVIWGIWIFSILFVYFKLHDSPAKSATKQTPQVIELRIKN